MKLCESEKDQRRTRKRICADSQERPENTGKQLIVEWGRRRQRRSEIQET